jgi:hypothetical protein
MAHILDDFFVDDIVVDNQRHIMFASVAMLQLLSRAPDGIQT